MLDSEWETLQQEADLYRLATHVHRGQSGKQQKVCLQVGQLFLLFLPLHKVTILQISSLYLTLLLFWNILLLSLTLLYSHYFLGFLCVCVCVLNTETAEVSAEKFLPTLPGFQASVLPSGTFLPWFPHCPAPSPPLSHMTSGQLPFYLNRASWELEFMGDCITFKKQTEVKG